MKTAEDILEIFDITICAERDAMSEQETKGPIHPLKTAIRDDMEYAWTVWCNIVMPIIDAGAARDVAERAATQIFYVFFEYDVLPMRKKFDKERIAKGNQ